MRLSFILFIAIVLASCSSERKNSPSIILYNGKIWTAENKDAFNEAIAISDNLISSVGLSKEILNLAGDSTRLIDLDGRLVIPGFNDAHIHFLNGSRGLTQVELTSTKNAQEVFDYLRKYAAENKHRDWITGRGWQYTFFDGGLPTKEMLDNIISDKPVYVRAYDGHSAWVNSKALELAGIDRTFKFTGFGEIVRSGNGDPSGILKESAMSLVSKLIPPDTQEENEEALRVGMKLAAQLGITSIQNASGSISEAMLYEDFQKRNELTLRTSLAFSVNGNTTIADLQSFDEVRKRVGTNSMLRANSIKFMIDGVIEGHTAFMLEPYSDQVPKEMSPTGQASMPLERFRDLVTSVDSFEFQIYTHAIGDRGVRETLNAYEYARTKNGKRDSRHRVEHIEMINSDDFKRFNELNVMPSMQPIHAEPIDGEGVWERAVGKTRLPNSFAWASMLKNDAKMVFSSDWPACLSINPIRGLHVAVTRKNPDGRPVDGWVPEQKISIGDALLAYTKLGAYSSFEENIKGQIATGFLADVIVLDQDLFSIDPNDTYKTKVVMTIFDGRIIYDVMN